MNTQVTRLAWILASVAFSGCSEQPPLATGDEVASTATGSSSGTPVAKTQTAMPSPMVLMGAGGEPVLQLQKVSETSYRARGVDAMPLFKVKVESDRVKIKDAGGNLMGKVKRKDGAFKVYDANDKVLFKAKRKDGKIKIKRDDGQEIGKLKNGTLTWNGQSVIARRDKELVVVEGPSGPLRTTGINPEHAIWLGIPQVDRSLRLGIVVFLRDVGF